jgi:hypothetical protein
VPGEPLGQPRALVPPQAASSHRGARVGFPGVAEPRLKGGHLARASGLGGGGVMTVTVDDRFCGAGGLSLGAELGGARLRLGLNHSSRLYDCEEDA